MRAPCCQRVVEVGACHPAISPSHNVRPSDRDDRARRLRTRAPFTRSVERICRTMWIGATEVQFTRPRIKVTPTAPFSSPPPLQPLIRHTLRLSILRLPPATHGGRASCTEPCPPSAGEVSLRSPLPCAFRLPPCAFRLPPSASTCRHMRLLLELRTDGHHRRRSGAGG